MQFDMMYHEQVISISNKGLLMARQELRVTPITFKRKASSYWEVGILINDGVGPVLDIHGLLVPEVYTMRRTGTFTVQVDTIIILQD